MKKVGFIGLGNMGGGMAKNLVEAKHEMTVYDSDPVALKRFEGRARLAADVLGVLAASDYVFFSLPSSPVVEGIVDQFIAKGVKDKTIIDTSTCYPLSTQRLARRLKEAGANMIDAPLLAGPAEAESGDLLLVVGGEDAVVKDVDDLFRVISKSYRVMGGNGAGHLTKLAVNFCSLTEALMFAQLYPVMERFGLKKRDVYDALNNEIFDNWIFQFYSDKYVKEEYRLDFAMALGLKDLSYMKRLYEEINVPGFLLDGALDLCRVSLLGEKPGEIRDFSYAAQTMADLVDRTRK